MKGIDYIRNLEGNYLQGIYSNQLTIFRHDKEIVMYGSVPVLEWLKEVDAEKEYLSLTWIEKDEGDDIFIASNSDIPPDTLNFEVNDDPEMSKYSIFASCFCFYQHFIKKVSVYGFNETNLNEFSIVLLETEKEFIIIEAGPVCEIRITTERPQIQTHFVQL